MDKSGGGEGAAAFVVYLMSMGTVCTSIVSTHPGQTRNVLTLS